MYTLERRCTMAVPVGASLHPRAAAALLQSSSGSLIACAQYSQRSVCTLRWHLACAGGGGGTFISGGDDSVSDAPLAAAASAFAPLPSAATAVAAAAAGGFLVAAPASGGGSTLAHLPCSAVHSSAVDAAAAAAPATLFSLAHDTAALTVDGFGLAWAASASGEVTCLADIADGGAAPRWRALQACRLA